MAKLRPSTAIRIGFKIFFIVIIFGAIDIFFYGILLHQRVHNIPKKDIHSLHTNGFDNYLPADLGLWNLEGTTSLLCMVLSMDKEKESAIAVKETWGKRCDKLIFISDKNDDDIGAIKLPGVKEGKEFLWGKTRLGFKFLYDFYLDDFDWFLKADLDTFVIMENLRYVLSPYDPEIPIALGERAVIPHLKYRQYLSGGSGYVLSRAALRNYGLFGYPNPLGCPINPVGGEDDRMGSCLRRSQILLGDTRDEHGKHRFHQYRPEDYIEGTLMKKYSLHLLYEYFSGAEDLSQTSISFHKVKSASDLYVIEFFIYGLEVMGLSKRFNSPYPAILPPDNTSVPKQVLEKYNQREIVEGMVDEEDR